MKMISLPIYRGWTAADRQSIVQLTAITGDPGHLWPYPKSALPVSIAEGMAGITDCYISGYAFPKDVAGGVEAIGEILVTRLGDVPESGKGYVYVVALDHAGGAFYRGPYIPYPEHYFSREAGTPIEALFGRVNLDDLGEKIV